MPNEKEISGDVNAVFMLLAGMDSNTLYITWKCINAAMPKILEEKIKEEEKDSKPVRKKLKK